MDAKTLLVGALVVGAAYMLLSRSKKAPPTAPEAADDRATAPGGKVLNPVVIGPDGFDGVRPISDPPPEPAPSNLGSLATLQTVFFA